MKPGILHAWLASLTELAAGAVLVVGLLTPLAARRVVGRAARRVHHQPPQGRVLRVPPPDRGLGVPHEPRRGAARDRRASGPGEWSLDNAIDFHADDWWGFVDRAGDRRRRRGRAARDVLAPARSREARRPRPRRCAARSCSTSSGSDLAPVADDADVGGVEDRRVGSGLIASTVPRGAHADRVVELAARADAHEQARRDRPAGDADLAGAREPALVGDLAGRAELGAEQRAQRLERVVLVGRDAACRRRSPRAPRRARRGRRRACARARGRDRAARSRSSSCADDGRVDARARASGACRRARSPSGSADVAPIAATSWPPNAGFHATSRSSSTLELDRVAGEPGAEPRRDARRDLAAPRGRAGEDRPRLRRVATSSTTAPATSSSTFSPSRCTIVVGAPRAERARRRVGSTVIATTLPVEPRPRAPSSSRVACARSGSTTTHDAAASASRSRDAGTVVGASARPSASSAPRSCEHAHRVARPARRAARRASACRARLDRHHLHRADRTSATRPGPTGPGRGRPR